MGLNHSKTMAENTRQGGQRSAAEEASHSQRDSRDSRNEPVTPRKVPRGHHYRQQDMRTTSPTLSSRSPEEAKLPESMREADMKENLSTMFHFIDNVGSTRRHSSSSRVAIHPIDEPAELHSSHTRRIESLPPPMHELKREERRGGSSSLPVRCPSRNTRGDHDTTLSSITEDDSEYLSRLYDLRTWNMYKLITESRKQRSINYVPNVVEETKSMDNHEDDADAVEDTEEPNSFTANMIFAFDL